MDIISAQNSKFTASIYYMVGTMRNKEDKTVNLGDITQVLLSVQPSRDIKIKYHNAVW